MQPIETRYRGYRFRSRLEARWAVFFDQADIRWEYEKQGFRLSDGTHYLPDFWLPREMAWVEIKGDRRNRAGFRKAKLLAEESGRPVYIFGALGRSGGWADGEGMGSGFDATQPDTIAGHDGDPDWSGFAWCLTCRTASVGRLAILPCGHWGLMAHPTIDAAYEAARAARFEHGETPTW